MKAYKRRHFFIDRQYQGRVIKWIFLICISGLVLDLGLFIYLSFRRIEEMRWTTHVQDGVVMEIVRTSLISSGIIALLVSVSALCVYSVMVRRQTAGPLDRLNKYIGAAAAGNLSLTMWLRDGDNFRETALELNRMISSVREDLIRLNEKSLVVRDTVKVLGYIADKPEPAVQQCQALIDSLEVMRKIRFQ